MLAPGQAAPTGTTGATGPALVTPDGTVLRPTFTPKLGSGSGAPGWGDGQRHVLHQRKHAVRDIHRQCRKAVQEHLVLEPVLNQAEESAVEVPATMDPSAIRLTGNVAGSPPFRGKLLHHGWRVKEIKLSRPPEGQDQFIVQPAEVEVT